jgi:hypothetical protein
VRLVVMVVVVLRESHLIHPKRLSNCAQQQSVARGLVTRKLLNSSRVAVVARYDLSLSRHNAIVSL